MSRNLYTIAIVSPGLELALRQMLKPHDADSLQNAEDMLLKTVSKPIPDIAFYQVVLDGWSRSHEDVKSPSTGVFATLRRDLDACGFSIVTCEECGDTEHVAVRKSEMNAYALSAYAKAIQEAARFAVATSCSLMALWRVVGPSFDDKQFASIGKVVFRRSE